MKRTEGRKPVLSEIFLYKTYVNDCEIISINCEFFLYRNAFINVSLKTR